MTLFYTRKECFYVISSVEENLVLGKKVCLIFDERSFRWAYLQEEIVTEKITSKDLSSSVNFKKRIIYLWIVMFILMLLVDKTVQKKNYFNKILAQVQSCTVILEDTMVINESIGIKRPRTALEHEHCKRSSNVDSR